MNCVSMTGSVFTAQFRQHNRRIAGLALLATGAGPFLTGLALITYVFASAPAPAGALVTLLCFALAGLLPWLALGHVAVLGNNRLRQRLAARLAATGADPEALTQGEFVGFSPGEQLRSWDGDTDRDVGLLALEPEALVYRGDEYTWVLRRQAIDALEPLPITNRLLRILVRWHAPRDPGRALTLASRQGRTLREANRTTAQLLHDLQQWKSAAHSDVGQPPALGLPPNDTSGSYLLDQPAAGSCSSLLAVTVIVALTMWHLAQRFISAGFYYHGVLWAGLVAVSAAVFTMHFLSYLQTYEAGEASR